VFEKLNSCKSHEEFLGHLACVVYHSTVTLCLAKPKWIWFDDEEKNGGNFNDEVLTREKERMRRI
jgi:hypothetical protein